MVGIAGVDMLPGGLHAGNLAGGVGGELGEEGVFELGRDGAGEDASNVHIGVAGAGEAKINDADDAVVRVEEDVAEVEVAMDELALLGGLDVGVVGVDVRIVVLVIEFVKEVAQGYFTSLGAPRRSMPESSLMNFATS